MRAIKWLSRQACFQAVQHVPTLELLEELVCSRHHTGMHLHAHFSQSSNHWTLAQLNAMQLPCADRPASQASVQFVIFSTSRNTNVHVAAAMQNALCSTIFLRYSQADETCMLFSQVGSLLLPNLARVEKGKSKMALSSDSS